MNTDDYNRLNGRSVTYEPDMKGAYCCKCDADFTPLDLDGNYIWENDDGFWTVRHLVCPEPIEETIVLDS